MCFLSCFIHACVVCMFQFLNFFPTDECGVALLMKHELLHEGRSKKINIGSLLLLCFISARMMLLY